MKIVFFNSCKKWGGGEKWHLEMASALKAKDFEITAFASKNSILHKEFANQNIRTHCISVSTVSFLNPIKLFKLTQSLKKINPDAIIMNMSADVKLAGIASKLAKVKHIIYRRGSAIPIKNSLLNRYLFKNIISTILANSQETKNTILANNKALFPLHKIKVVYNGINTNEFINQPFAPIYKKGENEIILGNLARLSHQKGQKYLIELGQLLKSNNVEFKILIGGSGELEQKLKEKVKLNGLTNEIIFLGFIKNAKDFLSSIDILVFPSIWEGFGFSIIEAKLMKKPILAFNTSSNPEVVQNNIDGFLTPPENITEFYIKAVKLINDSELRKKMGQNGFDNAIENFDLEISKNKIENFLENLS